jgi:hypothetical protein
LITRSAQYISQLRMEQKPNIADDEVPF